MKALFLKTKERSLQREGSIAQNTFSKWKKFAAKKRGTSGGDEENAAIEIDAKHPAPTEKQSIRNASSTIQNYSTVPPPAQSTPENGSDSDDDDGEGRPKNLTKRQVLYASLSLCHN